jgi:hypothetical protein
MNPGKTTIVMNWWDVTIAITRASISAGVGGKATNSPVLPLQCQVQGVRQRRRSKDQEENYGERYVQRHLREANSPSKEEHGDHIEDNEH